MENKSTIKDIINNQLCVGCGICVSEDKTNSLQMEWNEDGFLIPKHSENVVAEEVIRVCPFNPNPEEAVKDEDRLADLFLTTASQRHKKMGRYINTYVGYANEFRDTSSSGGLATYVFEYLLKQKIVDHLYIVKEINGAYEFQLFSTVDQIKQISKTRYIPVTLEKLFVDIHKIEGKIAVSGVACFIKAIRLKQHYHPELKAKIPFLVGIICGGLKSRFYTEYLAQKAGITSAYYKQDYRIKDYKSQASDYSFGAFDEDQEFKQVKMRAIGDMWGTGMFKSNACDFCDDVTTELADISVGDAWLNPYNNDGKGNSVIVTRSVVANDLILQGIDNGELHVEELSTEHFLISQQGSFNHRHNGLAFRIKHALANKQLVPPKRFYNEKSTFDFRIVQRIRMLIRQKSIHVWRKTKVANSFDEKMKASLYLLKTATRFYHHKKRLMNKINSK